MKKLVSGLLALALIFTLAAGCAQKEPPSGIFYDVTGLDARNTSTGLPMRAVLWSTN